MSSSLTQHLTEQLAALALTAQAIAVALSGGADSWALALLAHDYAKTNNLKFIALTIDHRLRPESAAEAATIAAECAKRGIPHATLVWQHDAITTRKQERARQARYDLLGAYCAAHGYTHLLTAHHADDQAETVLLRFARGSGVKGLAGMANSRVLSNGVTLLRPWLSIPKADLLAYAKAAGVPIAADPANADPAYARARLRDAYAVLAREGLTTATLLKTAGAARAEDAALEQAMQQLLWAKAIVTPDRIDFPVTDWQAAHSVLQSRAFVAGWRQLRGLAPGYPPERDAIAAALLALQAAPGKRTLGGLIIERTRDALRLCREQD